MLKTHTKKSMLIEKSGLLHFLYGNACSMNDELQKEFSAATVAICGLGGLGSNIAIALARAGIGKLILIDFDRVDITNLHRQQYKVNQIGRCKTDALSDNLKEIAPYIETETHTVRITEENATELLKDSDIVCEAFDNAECKAMLTNIQADLKTMTMNSVYAMSAITALTAQNTTGVIAIQESTPTFLKQQLDAIFEDIYPDAVKIGMVSSSELIRVIVDRLKHHKSKNIVVDPVMVATSGSALMKNDAVQTLTKELLPIATLVTPNIPEAEVLSGLTIESKEDMLSVAKYIGDTYGCAVLLKGGHSINDANDLLYVNGEYQWFCGKRIDNPNTHGTGCTLSSAIASNLAKGFDLAESVQRAKEYISYILSAQLDLGKGSGPMQHNFGLSGKFAEEKRGEL